MREQDAPDIGLTTFVQCLGSYMLKSLHVSILDVASVFVILATFLVSGY
jgi:hypothetical protein